MNHIYSVLWNSALGRFCVTSELGRSRSRATTRRSARRPACRRSALAALATGVALAWSAPAWSQATLPQGGQVVAGIATIGQSGRQMTVQQSSDKAIVNWQSFNIGANHQVTFQQPSHTAVALNRVIGADPTAIHGSLQANGRVFLVNPNGMLFGAGANVNVGGLVASTLDIADKDFLQGNYRFSGQGSGTQGAALRNAGRITAAEGGAVALLGGSVSNQGTIAARRGAVALAAGNQVKLDFAGDGLLNVQVQQSSLNALVENHQLIEADGGSVLMTAKATDALLQTVVNNTGTVRARTVENRAGKIVLLGGFDGGTTRVAGTLDASAPDGGDGGFVDTSGAHVQIEAGTRVTTRAAQAKTGTWLIDPTDFTIGAGAGPQTASGIGADTLTANLANNNVTLQTVAAGTEAGDMHVNAAVSWNEHELTLNAHRNININAVMSVNGDGKLALNFGGTQGNASATPVGDSNLNVNAGGRVDFAQTGAGLLSVNGHGYDVINHLQQLQAMGESANLDRRYALGGNIDASATALQHGGFKPIGSLASGSFTGVFDGLGHTISHLHIDRPQEQAVGLFGSAQGATLRNVAMVAGSMTGEKYTGSLVGYQTGGNISNAYSTANVTGNDGTGGLVGYLESGRISNAYTTGNVKGSWQTGGLVGNVMAGATGVQPSDIRNVYTTGSVDGRGNTGGLVGYLHQSSISDAYTTASVTGQIPTGGLLGYSNAGSISNSYWNTEITGQATSAGGGTGLTTAQMFDARRWTGFEFGTVWGNANGQTTPYLLNMAGNQVFNTNDLPAGAITARNRPALYTAVLNVNQLQAVQSNLSGRYLLGNDIDASATAGWNDGSGFASIGSQANAFTGVFDGLGHTVRQLYIYRPNEYDVGMFGYAQGAALRNIGLEGGSITGKQFVGALVGSQRAGSINNAYTTATVTGESNVGAMIGTQTGGRISDVHAEGSVTGLPDSYNVGGLVGSLYNGNISNAYATGAVRGSLSVGGLVGEATKSHISNAYATGRVIGASRTGGLAGTADGTDIGNAYATGYVQGSGYTGGLVGLQNDSDIRNSYWNVDTTGQANSSGGSGLTTAQMFDTAQWTGFEFGTVWGNAKGQTTPYLLNMAGNQVFNKNDLPVGPITPENRPALYTAVLNVNQLQAVQNNLSGRYLLGNDIEAIATAGWNNGLGFASIGSQTNAFTGVFDGLGHHIDHLTIHRPEQENVGLFGHTRNATLRNVGLVGGSVSGSSAVGMLVGLNEASDGNASITNAFATGDVTASESGAGGLIGVNQATDGGTSTVSNSHAAVSVTGNTGSGGLVGSNVAHSGSRVYISGSYATGDVSGVDDSGGLVGSNASYGGTASIAGSHASANVRVTGDDAGGLVGSNTAFGGNATIEQAYATGHVNAVNRAGGLVGSNVAGDGGIASIEVAFANGNVTASGDDAGGLVGSNAAYGGDATIERAYATGQVGASGDNAGGLVGQNRGSSGAAGIDQAYATGRVAAFGSHSGGLVGRNESSERNIFRAYWDSQSTGQAESAGGGVALTTAQMKQMASFDEWNISDQGGSDAVWRIYEGQTAPMLLSFMQAATVAAMEESVTREYNGTRVFNGIEHNHSGDSRVLGTLRYTASSKNVGSYSGEDLVVGGLYSSQLGYDISYASDAGLLVTPKKISQVTGITAQDRDYNGEHGVNLFTNAAQFEGRLGNDQLTVATASGAMDTKNAGDGKAVGITGITLGGDDKNNYELVRTTASTKVDIAKALIDQVTGITAENRGYNGQKDVNLLTNGAQFEGRLGNDQLTVATATGAMDTKNAGDGKAVGITSISLGGDDKDNYELVRTTASTKVDIAKALIDQVTGITAENRTYNGGLGVNLLTNGAQFEGRLGNDQLTVATASGAMDTKNAGDSKAVDITGITLGGTDAGNYTLVKTTAATKAHIDQRAIKAVITADDKTYDATMAAVTRGRLDALLGEDQVTLATNGIFATKDAGKDKTVNVSGSLAGTDAGNYRLEHNQTAKADIAQRAINAVITADGKTYDASRAAVTHGQLGTLLGEDQVTLATNGIFATKDAGKDKTVNVSGSLAGTDAGNYRLEHNETAKADIAQRAINAVITADGKTYDATRAAVTHGQLGTLLGDDQVTLATNGIFATKDAGKDKTVDVSGSLAGRDAGNYRLEHNETAKADVAQRAINAVITADGKTYDATMGAATHGQLGALLGEDRVTLATSGIFATKDAGKDKTVNVSGSLAGTDAGNYRLEHNETAKADIAQRAINAVITADGKSYDATMGAVTHGQLGALLGEDRVTLATSGIFATKDAGKDKTVNVSGSLAGTDAGNYRLEHNQTAIANIEQRAINAVITADSKTYDATMGAVTHGQLGALLAEDQVTLATNGIFATKDAGTDKTVNVSGTLSGADAGNYRLEHNQTAKADIAQRAINAVITADGKTYDATTWAVTHGKLGALLGEDRVTLATSGIFATKDAGTDKTVNVSGTLSGADAGNYRLEHNQTAKADIAQRTINAVISADGKTYDATMGAVTHGQLGALLGEDRVTLATSGIFATKDAGKDKTVNVSGSLAGTDAGNYRLVHNATAQADIDQLAIEVLIGASNKTYDATTAATTQGSLGNSILGSDQVALATRGQFADRSAGTDKSVSVSGTLSGADAGNYRLVHNQTTMADIARLTIQGAITAENKTYDGLMGATTHGDLGNAVLGQDQVTLVTTGRFDSRNAGENKAVALTAELKGADAGNYLLVHNDSTSADIDPRAINAVITANGKTYDATRTAMTQGQLGDRIGEDQLTLATSGSFVEKDAGTGKTVNVTGTLSGADAGNYRLVHNATAQADISQLVIHASIAADDKDYDGGIAATTRGALTGVLAGDSVALRTRGSFLDPAAGSAKLVRVGATLDGEDAGNYRLEHNASTWAAIRPEATVKAAVLTDVHAGAHPSRIEVARPEASASLSACLGDVYPLPAQVMNLGGLAGADAQQQRQPAIVFARVGGSVSDRACARTPF